MLKKYGIHHIPLGLLITIFLGPLVCATAFLFKELGEATIRAGGTREAFKKKWGKDYYGRKVRVWEFWDFITPSIAGFILYAIIKAFQT